MDLSLVIAPAVFALVFVAVILISRQREETAEEEAPAAESAVATAPPAEPVPVRAAELTPAAIEASEAASTPLEPAEPLPVAETLVPVPQPVPAVADQQPEAGDDQRRVTLAQVMLPEDANPRGNVHGGTLMKLADTAGGTCAARHARSQVVTVVMDSMTFEQPVYVGDLVTLYAEVTWTGRTSLETHVTIDAENVVSGDIRRVSSAYFVYVALDAAGRPKEVPPLVAETEAARRRWQEAEQRRARRLRESS